MVNFQREGLVAPLLLRRVMVAVRAPWVWVPVLLEERESDTETSYCQLTTALLPFGRKNYTYSIVHAEMRRFICL